MEDSVVKDGRRPRELCTIRLAAGSSGTLHRGQMISRCELQSGDVFQIGQTLIRFDGGGEAEESTLHGPIDDVTPAAPLRTKVVSDLMGKSLECPAPSVGPGVPSR